MKNPIRISKYLQVMVLLSFLLPFFPKGCEQKKSEDAMTMEQMNEVKPTVTDSTTEKKEVATHEGLLQPNKSFPSDSISNDSLMALCETTKQESAHLTLTEKLSAKSPLLELILLPSTNYSGLGYVMDMLESSYVYANQFGVVIGFLFLLLGLIIKLKDFNNLFMYFNALAVYMVFITKPMLFAGSTRLWGFWVCMVLMIIMVAYDLYVLVRKK
ncbi:MAG TPA: hypothetical protein VIK29_11845 [Paludibacter sp.]